MVGTYVQVYEGDRWRLGMVVGWDAKKREHVLMNAGNEFFSLFIGDFFHFFRTGEDVQRELTWGKMGIVKAIELDTLLMQSAAEDETEDELILPEGFFTRKKDICEVGNAGGGLWKVCKKKDSKDMILCDNCDCGYHLRCVKLEKLPSVGLWTWTEG